METVVYVKEGLSKDTTNRPPVEIIRGLLYKKNVLTTYDKKDGRMICYTSKKDRFNNANYNNIWLECNGLIFDINTMTILVIPVLSYITNIIPDIVDSYINQKLYTLNLIEDGTVINLYYYEKHKLWQISTTRGYNMTHMKWGSKSYSEIIEELLSLYNVTLDTFLEQLDKTRCYTFGFKHESMHSFYEGRSPINKMWYIQSVNLQTGCINTTFNKMFNIPDQTTIEFPDNKPNSCKTLFSILNNCLRDFVQNQIVNYGFILKSKDSGQTKLYSNIMLESSLLQKIRQLYYNDLFSKDVALRYDKTTSIILYAYLDFSKHKIFFNDLFPQFMPAYYKLQQITYKLSALIIHIANNRQLDTCVYTVYHKIARVLHEQLSNICTIGTDVNKISSYILNKKFMNIYYTLYMSDVPTVKNIIETTESTSMSDS